MGWSAATPGSRETWAWRVGGSPTAAGVVTVTSAPLVSLASTLDCAVYVELNTAVDTAKEPVRAMIINPRERSRRCRDIAADTTVAKPPASGRVIRAITRRPRTRMLLASLHANRVAPTHSRSGARNVR